MMEEMYVFVKHFIGLVFGVLIGIAIGGLWAVGPTLFKQPLGGMTLYLQPEIERSLSAEADFAASCPWQEYVIQWWGWSPDAGPSVVEGGMAVPPNPGAVPAPFVPTYATYTPRFGPWLRLVAIRSVVALSILVAAILPTMALWLDGRRRAYALLATGTMPSGRLWQIWWVLTALTAMAGGTLIGAPLPIAMAPWITMALLAALVLLCQVRAHLNARLS